jgi:NAD+ diphosphatase
VTYPHVRLTANPHDRTGLRRDDNSWLEQRWADPSSRVLVVSGTRIHPVDGKVEWLSPHDAPDGMRVLLGEQGGVTWFAVIVDPAVASEEKSEWFGLRAAFPHLSAGGEDEAPLLFHAIGLAEWHYATRFCPRCGGELEVRKAGHEKVCTRCGKPQFPRLDPAVIMVVAEGEPGSEGERCLLGRQSAWPEGRYSTLAGFCEPGETLEDAVRREVAEEVGIRVGAVEYFGNQPWPLPASLMLGFIARAETREIAVDGEEIEDARWFTRADMKQGAEAGTLVLPGGISISRSLVEHWYGGPLAGHW